MEGKEKNRKRTQADSIEEYLDALCGQIYWKSYRKAIRDELKDHIEDASSEMRKRGFPQIRHWKRRCATWAIRRRRGGN